MERYRDYSGRYDLPYRASASPADLVELVDVVRRTSPDWTISAVGQRWAFSAPGYNPDLIIDTRGLADFPDWMQAATRQARGVVGPLVAVEAGIRVRDLYFELIGESRSRPPRLPDAIRGGRRLALPVIGGAGAQSLAGVVSTGTHGGWAARKPIGDAVRAAIVVGSGGRVRVVQDSKRRVLDVDALNRSEPARRGVVFERYEQPGGLNAVRTSVGRLGVVYAYVVEAVDDSANTIAQWRYEDRWSRLRVELHDMVARAVRDDEALQVVFSTVRAPLEDRPCVVSRELTAPAVEAATLWRRFGDDRLDQAFRLAELHGPTSRAPTDVRLEREDAVMACIGQVFAVHHETPTVRDVRSLLYGLAAAASLATVSAGGPILLLLAAPYIAMLVEAASDLADLSERRLFGNVIAEVLDRLSERISPVVTALIMRAIIMGQQPTTRRDRGPWLVSGDRAVVSDFYDYTLEDAGRPTLFAGDSIEVFFPVGPNLIADVEGLLGRVEDMQWEGTPLGAYISLRFMRKSDALLSTTDRDAETTCSVEISMLGGLRGNDTALERLRDYALAELPDGRRRGRVHWGQRHDLDESSVAATMPELAFWRTHLEQLEGTSPRFLTPFAQARGLVVRDRRAWDGWRDLGVAVTTDPHVASGGRDGRRRCVVLAGGTDRRLGITHPFVTGLPGWIPVGDWTISAGSAPTGHIRADDARLEAFAVLDDGRVMHAYQEAASSPTRFAWRIKPRNGGVRQFVEMDEFASVAFGSDRFEAYAIETEHWKRLLHTGAGLLDAFVPFPELGDVEAVTAVGRSRPQALGTRHDAVVVAVSRGRIAYRLHDDRTWAALPPLPDGDALRIAIAGDTIVAIGFGGGYWFAHDVQPASLRPHYRDWRPLPAPAGLPESPMAGSRLGVAATASGTWLFAMTRMGRVAAIRRRDGAWGTWTDLGGAAPATSRPAGGVLPDGRAIIVVREGGGPGGDRLRARAEQSPGTW